MEASVKRIICLLLCVAMVLPFSSCKSDEKLGVLNTDYTGGKYAVPNGDIVMIQVNELAAFALNKSVMPALTAFTEGSFSHQSFYAQRGDSEGIYSALTGLYAPIDGIDTDAAYYTLAHLLKDNGYTLNAYAADKDKALMAAMGFDGAASNADGRAALKEVAALKDNGKKDFAFFVLDAVSYPYIPAEDGNASVSGNGALNSYFSCAGYADKLLDEFLKTLDSNATLIIYGTAPKLSEKFGTYAKQYKDLFENGFSYDQAFQTPLIIRSGKGTVGDKAASLATVYDLYPTVASLLKLKSNKMLFSGDNLLSDTEKGRFFALQGAYKRGYFITDNLYYIKPEKIASVYDKATMEQLFEDYTELEAQVLSTINECEQAVKQGFFDGTVSYKQLYANMPSADTLTLAVKEESGGGSLASHKAFLASNARTYSAAALDGIWNGTCFKEGVITLADGVESGSVVTGVLKQKYFEKLYVTPAAEGGKIEVFASYEGDNGVYTSWQFLFSHSSKGASGDGALTVEDITENVRLKFVLTRENGIAPTLRSVTLAPTASIELSEQIPYIEEPVLDALEVFAPEGYNTKTFSGVLAIEALVSTALGKKPDIENVMSLCCNSDTATVCETTAISLAYYAASKGLTAYVDKYLLSDLISTLSAPQQVILKTGSGYVLAIGYDEENIIAILPESGETTKIPFKDYNIHSEVIIVDSNLYTPEIIESIVPENSCIRPGEVVDKKKYIVIHNTGNYSPGATALAHANYLHAQTNVPDRQASWHYTVDDKEIYHHIPDNENAWHASDGSYGEGNYYGIGIEVCVNNFPNTYEGEEYEAFLQQFMRTIKNTAYLAAKLMIENDIGMDGIKQHYDFAPDKKNCPMQMRYTSATGSFTRDDGDMWNYLLAEIEKQYNSMKGEK